MNDNLIAQEIAAVLKTASAYADLFVLVPSIEPAQAGAQLARPNLEISGTWSSYGPRRKGLLTLTLRGRMGDEQESPGHNDRFTALFTALCGAPGSTMAETKANFADAKTVLKAAVAARGFITLDEYGIGEDAVNASHEDEDLVTTLQLMCIWTFIPQA